jgi:prepilin-type N-terminal cleavage/methylation domain-containing protein
MNASILSNTSHNRSQLKRLLQKEKGYTIIELMVVIVIVGILASIAIGIIIDSRERACVSAIKSDLSNAYKTSAALYAENPENEIELGILYANGFIESEDVEINVVDGNWDTLRITGSHPSVLSIYEMDNTGRVFKQ